MPIGGTYKLAQWPSEAISFNDKLTVHSCPTCHIVHAIPEQMDERMHTFNKAEYPNSTAYAYCPNGHQWHYRGKSAATKQAEQDARDLATTRLQLSNTEAELTLTRKQRTVARTKLTKTLNLIIKGMCPFGCRRHFNNVEAHIATQHKGSLAAVEAAAT